MFRLLLSLRHANLVSDVYDVTQTPDVNLVDIFSRCFHLQARSHDELVDQLRQRLDENMR